MSTKDVATTLSIFVITILAIIVIWLMTHHWSGSVKSGIDKIRAITISGEVINDNKIQPGPVVVGDMIVANDNLVTPPNNQSGDTMTVIVQPVSYQSPKFTYQSPIRSTGEESEMRKSGTEGAEAELALNAESTNSKAEIKKDFAINSKAILSVHNALRAEVGMEGLQWSEQLAKDAQSYADQLGNNCELVHDKTTNHGENLFYGWYQPRPDKFDSSIPSVEWGAEQKFYNYHKNSCEKGQVCGHYTQMVWRDTTNVGCGQATCKRSETENVGSSSSDDVEIIQVCRYSPAGNYLGQKPY